MSPLHFSDLKKLSVSAAHFRYWLDHQKPMTPAMRIGMCVDRILTGGRVPPAYPGSNPGGKKNNLKRQGAAWRAFVRAKVAEGWREDEILTAPEDDESHEIARVVAQDELAMEYLDGRPQVALEWTMMDVPRRTRGIDVVGPKRIVELKVSHDVKPDRLMRHATNMLWHAQLADYREAARQNGIDASSVYLVAVEASPPYVSTVLEVSEEMLAEGEKCIHIWLERYKACAAADFWPGYSQCPVLWEPWQPRGIDLVGFDDEEEEVVNVQD